MLPSACACRSEFAIIPGSSCRRRRLLIGGNFIRGLLSPTLMSRSNSAVVTNTGSSLLFIFLRNVMNYTVNVFYSTQRLVFRLRCEDEILAFHRNEPGL